MKPGELVMHIGDDPENVGLVIDLRPQFGGHDHGKALVLWVGESEPIWEKTFLLVRIRKEEKT